MLQQLFVDLASKFCTDHDLVSSCWQEIEKQYSGKKRHYHTLAHLQNMQIQLAAVAEELQHPDAVWFALFYHDIIYDIHKKDNEEKSAVVAQQRLVQMSVPQNISEACVLMIIATKQHQLSADNDTNLFTDADLSVLGQPWPVYDEYRKQVRKEYSFYPDLLYKPGRKKVLQHFLEMDNIFKTSFFSSSFEKQARENLQREFDLL